MAEERGEQRAMKIAMPAGGEGKMELCIVGTGQRLHDRQGISEEAL